MPYKDRAKKLEYGKNYHKRTYVPRPRKLRTDKEYVIVGKERRSKESIEHRKTLSSEWHVSNRDRRLKEQRLRYVTQWDRVKDKYLRYKFGITLDEYRVMWEAQEGVCAVCKRPETVLWKGQPKLLAVDHNHSTGEVRQLLCQSCNLTLGALEANPEIVALMLAYLRKHNAKMVVPAEGEINLSTSAAIILGS